MATKDEEYVVLSPFIRQGQEWDFVYVLNVATATSIEFAAGKPELLEEERRLLYVAMTRARNELHLCAPLKYQVTQQAGMATVMCTGRRAVHDRQGAGYLRKNHVSEPLGAESLRAGDAATVDVVAELKEMW